VAGPEDKAREHIDQLLRDAGWHVVDPGEVKLTAFREEIATLVRRPSMRSVQFTIQDAALGRRCAPSIPRTKYVKYSPPVKT